MGEKNLFSGLSDGRTVWILSGIVIFGFLFRIIGINFGMPIVSNLYIRPDESLVIEPALHLFERWGDPEFYVYPALTMEISAVLYQLYYLLFDTTGISIIADFAQDPNPYYLIPRLISVIAGTINVYFIYVLGLSITSTRGSLVAALLYAASPLAVRDAHFGVTDTPMVLFLTLSAIVFIRYLTSQNSRQLYLSSGLFGLAAASKFTALLLGPRIVLFLITGTGMSDKRKLAKRIGLTIIISLFVFFILNPYILPNLRLVVSEIIGLLKIFYLAQEGDPPWTLVSALNQIFLPLRFGPGEIIGLLFSVVGIGWLPNNKRKKKAVIFISGYIVLHLLALLPFRHTVPFRYLLPVLPFLAVFCGKGINDLMNLFQSRVFHCAVIILLVFGFGISTARSMWIDLLLSTEDTRVSAGKFVEDKVPRNIPVIYLVGPESEPQILESSDSLIRRMEYVSKRYGPKAGEFISKLYKVQNQRPDSGSTGWSIYRYPDPVDFREGSLVIITSSHPLPFGNTPENFLKEWQGETIWEKDFISIRNGERAIFDAIDAFFLPFTDLWKVTRPGPNLRVTLLKGGTPGDNIPLNTQ